MDFLYTLIQQLGILEVPLLLCSVVVCVVGLERLFVLSGHSLPRLLRVKKLNGKVPSGSTLHGKTLHEKGQALIQQYAAAQEEKRSSIASFWLFQQKKRLSSGLRLLHLVALIAPLLGLLGTVLGLVQAFDNISQQSGPVEVSILAEGLGVAMSTTAVGLLIAVPAVVLSHLYSLWIDTLMDRLELAMNKAHLSVDVPVDISSVEWSPL